MPRFFYTTDNEENFEPYSIEDIMDLFNYLNDIAPNKWYTASHMEVWSKTDTDRGTLDGEYSCYNGLWENIFGSGKQGCYSSNKKERVKYAGWLELRLWGEHPKGIDKIEINIPIIYENINKTSIASPELNFNNNDNITEIRAIISDKDNKIVAESNILKYTNLNPITNGSKTADLIKNLKLTTNDKYNGSYYVYNQINKPNVKINNNSIKATIDCIKSGNEDWDNAPINITWELPNTGSSMLKTEEVKETTSVINFTSEDYEGYKIGDSIQKEFLLSSIPVKEIYSDGYYNNIIKCTVEKTVGNKTHSDTAEIELKFGRQGSSGTQYTFQITPINNRHSFVIPYPGSSSQNPPYLDGFVALEAILSDPSGVTLNVSSLTNWSLLQTGKYNGATEYVPVSFWNYNKETDKLSYDGKDITKVTDFPLAADSTEENIKYDHTKFAREMNETNQV